MAVELFDLVEALKREVSPPGTDLYPNATDDEVWVGHLRDAFWEARLHGMLSGFTEEEGVVSPIRGTDDLPRDLQQVLVLYAGYRIVLTSFQNVTAVFRAKAGPVEFETQRSAQVLKGVLDAVRERIKLALARISDLGTASEVTVLDAVVERSYAVASGSTWWVR